jgi:alpha-galactosidase
MLKRFVLLRPLALSTAISMAILGVFHSPRAIAQSTVADGERPILTPKPGPAPKINGPAVYGCRQGSQFIYRIPCTGTRPMTFAAKQLPLGLVLDAKKGILSGAVLAPRGDHVIALRATNAAGSDEKTLKLVVGDTLALTPPMGWNSWYSYYYYITQEEMCKQADAMVSSGMADFGYQYVSLDDAWMKKVGDPPYRDEKGDLLPSKHFPNMRKMTDYLHAYGLKAGIYTAIGPYTCAWYAGSYKHERADVKQFAAWGFDFLKLDTCSYKHLCPNNETTVALLRKPFKEFGDALKEVDRDIVYNACAMKGKIAMDSWEWVPSIGGNSWRTGSDVNTIPDARLPGFYKNAMDNAKHAQYAGPGHWNDPDYLIIGHCRNSNRRDQPPRPAVYTADEHYSYMSMWCLMAAPLCFGGDMTQLDEFTINILCNAEVIAIDQDPLGKQGTFARKTEQDFVMVKPLEDGSLAIGLFNLADATQELKVSWKEIGLKGKQVARDLWRQKDLGAFEDSYSANVGRHGVSLIRIRPAAKQ